MVSTSLDKRESGDNDDDDNTMGLLEEEEDVDEELLGLEFLDSALDVQVLSEQR